MIPLLMLLMFIVDEPVTVADSIGVVVVVVVDNNDVADAVEI